MVGIVVTEATLPRPLDDRLYATASMSLID
jgi:hypothetical protein